VDIESSGVFSKLAIYKEPWRPCIFIAPGTGIAPCRSLIWERASKRADQTKVDVGDNYLFFGGRNKDADYFYKEDWTRRSLATTVFTAFSRDQKEKIYVQDIIREQGILLANLLTNAMEPIIFVCGSSGNMPKAVRAALVDVLLTHSKEYKERGRDWVEKELELREKNGSYIQETW
jgi:sulfite reductase alpha subunit-like flavoprotein